MTKQQQLISNRTNEELLKDWTALDSLPMTKELPMIRGWYMDEIENRFPTEFDQWIENCHIDDNIANYITL